MPLPYAVFIAVFAGIMLVSIGWQFGAREETRRRGEWVDTVRETVLDGITLAWWIALPVAAVVALLVGWLA